MASPAIDTTELELVDEVGPCYADPARFVLGAFPWGEPGPLKDYSGPDPWQREFLEGIGAEVRKHGFDGMHAVSPIRRAVSSGHGIGKSTLAAWLVCWIMSTRPHAQGTITANTYTQLETKTWAAVKRWMALCTTNHWFVTGDQRMYHKDHKDSWFCSPQSSKEENSESFAGQHAVGSTSFYIFDEDSGISDGVHEVAEGGLTDGEPMIFLFGNCTRISGYFHRACFGQQRHIWAPIVVDSRHSSFTNKEQIQEWLQEYGEDSDFFRVRVRGLAPRASDAQYIDHERILQAQKRQVVVFPDEPLVAGVDFAWGGSDDNVVRFRRGADAKSIPCVRVKGEFTRDPGVMTTRLADILRKEYDGRKVAMLFLDSAGIAGPIAARLRALGYKQVQEVNFGADSPDSKFRFFRDYMWGQMKDWLLTGAIDRDSQLEADLIGPGTRPDMRQRVWLESKEDMKKRGLDSPDDGDALASDLCDPDGAAAREEAGRGPAGSVDVVLSGFYIGERHVGDGAPCLIVAEVGLAHEGVQKIAHDYIDAIFWAGADAIKFQCHLPEHECSRDEPWRIRPYWRGESRTRYDYWERTSFGYAQWAELESHAREKGLLFLCSPFSVGAVSMMNPLVLAWKIASGEVTNKELLGAIQATGKPVILSSGMATVDEIVLALQALSPSEVKTLQCTSLYPCPPDKIGLSVVGGSYDGLSDHSGSIWPSVGAAARGASIVEVHVIFSRDIAGFDTSSSITVAELQQMVHGIRFLEQALIPTDKDQMAKELEATRELFMGKRKRMNA